jgi:hypothetical protein
VGRFLVGFGQKVFPSRGLIARVRSALSYPRDRPRGTYSFLQDAAINGEYFKVAWHVNVRMYPEFEADSTNADDTNFDNTISNETISNKVISNETNSDEIILNKTNSNKSRNLRSKTFFLFQDCRSQ